MLKIKKCNFGQYVFFIFEIGLRLESYSILNNTDFGWKFV